MMWQNETEFFIADNCGAVRARVIRCLGGSNRRYARIGNIVVGTVKKAKPNGAIKKSQIVLALVISTKKAFHRENNSWIKSSKNYAVLVTKDEKGKYKPLGTRIFIPLLAELDKPEYKEIFSLAPGVI